MADYDVFNGDADGICALIQLRLAMPRESRLVTGIKRDIALLKHVTAKSGDRITVLDISMEKNRSDLMRLLAEDAQVFYVDHHQVDDVIKHANLETHIDLKPTVCTALIVNQYLNNRFYLWAITAAFGDNLDQVALKLADKMGVKSAALCTLQELGMYLNYNGYGSAIEDLFFHPADLYQACAQCMSPIDFVNDNVEVFNTLKSGYQSDMAKAMQQKPFHSTTHVAAMLLPDDAWARRVSGVLGNYLSNQHPQRAHAILTPNAAGYQVSIRAPQSCLQGADEIAGQFATGGGRKGAAGINQLAESELPKLLDLMAQHYC